MNEASIVSPRARRLAGWTLVVAAVLSLVAMSHHPVGHGADPGAIMRSILEIAATSAVVHGSLIALMLATAWALLELSAWRGFSSALVRAALPLYVIGVLAMIVAALVNGFVTTRIAARFIDADAAGQLQAQGLFALCWAINQTAAKFAVALFAGAIALWSLDFVRDRGGARALGIFGVAVAVACVAALGVVRLDVRGMLLVSVALAVWQAAVGVWMLRSR